jgi:magnesium transporter
MEEVNPNHLPFELTKEFIEDIRLLIENQANEEILLKLDELFPADITHILIELTTEEAKYLVLLIDTKIAAEIISTLDTDDRKKFLKNFTSKEIASYLNVIDSDDAVDILNEQPVKVRAPVSYTHLRAHETN